MLIEQGWINGNPVADRWAGAVMQKPLGIQKCDGRTDKRTDGRPDRRGKVYIRVSVTKNKFAGRVHYPPLSMDLYKSVSIKWLLSVTEKKIFITSFMFSVKRQFEWYAALYTYYKSSITKAWKGQKIFWTDFDTIVIVRRQKQPPPKGFLFD